jgi:hypothetical protein
VLAGGVGAAVAAIGIAVATADARLVFAVSQYGGSLVMWAVAWSLTWLVWTSMLSRDRAGEAGVAMACAPALLTGLLALETFTGVAGPNPMISTGIAGGVLLAGAAILGVRSLYPPADLVVGRPRVWALILAALPLVVALAGLALPALGGSVWADRKGTAFEVAWTLSGWESIAAWIVVASALLAFAAAAYPLLAATPFRSLTGWLPTDVMADLGTEYAWIHFDALSSRPAWIALAGAMACAALVLTGRLVARSSRRGAAGPRTEEIK